jgi:hypothetical protein
MTLSHVAEAPNAARLISFNGQDLGIALENSPIFRFQKVEAVLIGGANFLDASNKPSGVSKT